VSGTICEDYLGTADSLRWWAIGDNRAVALESLRSRARTVKNRDVVTGAEQAPRHRRAHYPCSNPSNLHDNTPEKPRT
jgi:hypothetical protein